MKNNFEIVTPVKQIYDFKHTDNDILNNLVNYIYSQIDTIQNDYKEFMDSIKNTSYVKRLILLEKIEPNKAYSIYISMMIFMMQTL